MRVDEFVAATLEQIIRGIAKAQVAVEGTGGRINPQVANIVAEVRRGLDMKTHTRLQNVEFDIGVTVTESSQSGADVKVGVPWLGGKVEAGSDKQQSAANRIRFTVPVVFPRQFWKDPATAPPALEP